MKYYCLKMFELLQLKIKKYQWFNILLLLMIYGMILPICITNALGSQDSPKQLVCMMWMERLIPVVFMLFLYVYNKEWMREEWMSFLKTLDNELQILHFIFMFFIFQLLLLPFYICVEVMISYMIQWIVIFFLQCLVLTCVLIFVNLLLKKDVLVIGILLLYVLLLTMMEGSGGIFSIFVFENASFEPVFIIGMCLKLICISLFCLLCSIGLYSLKRT